MASQHLSKPGRKGVSERIRNSSQLSRNKPNKVGMERKALAGGWGQVHPMLLRYHGRRSRGGADGCVSMEGMEDEVGRTGPTHP